MNDFKDLNIADVFTLRYTKTAGGAYQHTMTPAEFEEMQGWLDRAMREASYEQYSSGWNAALEMAAFKMCNELQRSMPDTAASFAAFVRGCKK